MSSTRNRVEALYKKADAKMKATEGHQFMTVLKTRCQLCGRSPKQKGQCPFWIQTFVDALTPELLSLLDSVQKEAAIKALERLNMIVWPAYYQGDNPQEGFRTGIKMFQEEVKAHIKELNGKEKQ